MSVRTEIVGPDRFDDVARLFGPNGASSGCWCMWWRKPNREWNTTTGTGNREDFEAAVRSGTPVGLLAYADDGAPVGWAATAPRPAYPRLLRSTTLRLSEPDDPGVWSVPCFYIHRAHRRAGVATALLGAAVGYARARGAHAVEGYPSTDGGRKPSSNELFTGTVGMFLDHGFARDQEAGRRVVMRLDLGR